MSEAASVALSQCMSALSQAVEEYPLYMPVIVVAQLLHLKPEALRASIEQGKCPFGFCWQLGDRTSYKIPTLTFVQWFTNGHNLSS